MREIFDEYCLEKHKQVITFDIHQIAGLKNFAHWNTNHASTPTPLHYHSDIVEFHCLVTGKRETTINDLHYIITGNEMLITFPYELHKTSDIAASPCEFYGFQIDLKDKSNLLGLNSTSSQYLSQLLLALPNRHLKVPKPALLLLKKAFQNLSSQTTNGYFIGLQYLCCFLFQLNRLTPVNQKTDLRNLSIDRTVQYINNNFYEDIPLESLAKLAGYSLSSFKSKFKAEIGIPPAEYITRQRIEFAKNILKTSDKAITEIAFDCGYTSSNYFCSVFKKYTGCSPLSYRRRFLNRNICI